MVWSYKTKGLLFGFILALAYLIFSIIMGRGFSLGSNPLFTILITIFYFAMLSIFGFVIGSFIDNAKLRGEKETYQDGSNYAFWWSLIGGILGLLISGYYLIFKNLSILKIPSSYFFIYKVSAVMPILFAVVIIIASFYMRKDSTLKLSSIAILILSVLSSNIISFVGAINGLMKRRK